MSDRAVGGRAILRRFIFPSLGVLGVLIMLIFSRFASEYKQDSEEDFGGVAWLVQFLCQLPGFLLWIASLSGTGLRANKKNPSGLIKFLSAVFMFLPWMLIPWLRWWSLIPLLSLFFLQDRLRPFFLSKEDITATNSSALSATDAGGDFAIEIPAAFRRERALWQKWCEYYRSQQPLLQRKRADLQRMDEHLSSMTGELSGCELEREGVEHAGAATQAEADMLQEDMRLEQQHKDLQSFLARQKQQRQQLEQQLHRQEHGLQLELQEWRLLALQLQGFALESANEKSRVRDLPKRYQAELAELHQKIRTMELERSAEQELADEELMREKGPR